MFKTNVQQAAAAVAAAATAGRQLTVTLAGTIVTWQAEGLESFVLITKPDPVHVQGMCGLACHQCQPHKNAACLDQGIQAQALKLSVGLPTARLAVAMPIQWAGPARLQYVLLSRML